MTKQYVVSKLICIDEDDPNNKKPAYASNYIDSFGENREWIWLFDKYNKDVIIFKSEEEAKELIKRINKIDPSELTVEIYPKKDIIVESSKDYEYPFVLKLDGLTEEHQKEINDLISKYKIEDSRSELEKSADKSNHPQAFKEGVNWLIDIWKKSYNKRFGFDDKSKLIVKIFNDFIEKECK